MNLSYVYIAIQVYFCIATNMARFDTRADLGLQKGEGGLR